jgi:hypothetical protein
MCYLSHDYWQLVISVNAVSLLYNVPCAFLRYAAADKNSELCLLEYHKDLVSILIRSKRVNTFRTVLRGAQLPEGER